MSEGGVASVDERNVENANYDLSAVKFQLGLQLNVAIKRTTTYVNSHIAVVVCLVISFIIQSISDIEYAKSFFSLSGGGSVSSGGGGSVGVGRPNLTAGGVLSGLLNFAAGISAWVCIIFLIISIVKLSGVKETFGFHAIRWDRNAETLNEIAAQANKMRNCLIANVALGVISLILLTLLIQSGLVAMLTNIASIALSVIVFKGRNRLRELKNENSMGLNFMGAL